MTDDAGAELHGKRARTARAIHHATLDLAVDHGLDAVTVDTIAERAGISRRTFFNYFKNKEEALAGPRTRQLGTAFDWFATSQGPLLPDLQRLIRQIVLDARPEHVPIRNIGRIVKAAPELQPLFSDLIDGFASELTPLLARRLDARRKLVAPLLARAVGHAIALSFQGWTMGDESSIEHIAETAGERIRLLHEALSA
ncbi:TetR family transcriptional regulator [Salipiger sp. IMCC34102]|uniref:TetR/AcrR family transcriptional regulator n=1 Tax=Salipiger sp. IMCC34102 TaxID=2510647 RepID=UPI00101E0B09|nr:TetR/AcrR family transcriptional regulator [Salipiger sp. IMCC34102]RYH03188.1 TetR family transcriptional regulator [Salipiger sp. IMCC34102]